MPTSPLLKLGLRQKRRFFRDGFLMIPGAVSQDLIPPAVSEIDRRMATGLSPDEKNYAQDNDYLAVHSTAPALMKLLLATSLWDLGEALLGEGSVEPCTEAQMALRHPSKDAVRGTSHPTPGVHIDSWRNKRDDGKIIRHTLTVGVLLSDIPGEYAGNLTVFPGSHALLARHFKKHGLGSLDAATAKIVKKTRPVQITGKKGDAVLLHYQLLHGVENNYSLQTRYMAYFRLYHVDAWRDDTRSYLKRALTDIWLEWGGMAQIVP